MILIDCSPQNMCSRRPSAWRSRLACSITANVASHRDTHFLVPIQRVDGYPVNRGSRNVGSYLTPPLHELSLSGIMIWHLRACGGSLRPRFSRFNRRESAGLRDEGRGGIHEDPEEERTPFVPRRLCDRRHVKRSPPLTLYSQNINKEPATQRARSKYNVPPDLPSLLPRFTAFLVLHDPYHRASSSFPRNFTTFHHLILSHFPSFIPPPSRCASPLSLRPFLALWAASLHCQRAFGEILIPLCQLHSRTSRAWNRRCAAHPRSARFSHRESRDNS